MPRTRSAKDTAEGLGDRYRYPSEYIDEIEESAKGLDSAPAKKLHENRKASIRRDANFRQEHVRFDHAEELVDKKSTDTNEEGIPARNRIRRIVEDLLSVVLPNVPNATLRADAPVDPTVEDEKQRLQQEYIKETEKISNQAVKSIFRRSDWSSEQTRVIYDAVVDGVGYAHPRIEPLASRRRQPRLDSLLMKPTDQWGAAELEKFERLIQAPYTDHVEAKEVFWREGVRSVDDDDMTRVSRVRKRDVQWLRDYYEDSDIEPTTGNVAPYLDYDEDTDESLPEQAGYAETWQIEEFVTEEKERFFMGGGLRAADAQWTIQYEDAIMVYTVITTNKLLEYHVFTPEEVPMELPFVPFYIKTSKRHPYGFSVPLMLELQQRFVNKMLAIMAEQAMNSIAPNTFAVFLEHITGQDREEINRAIEEGGLAELEGNDTNDISDIIQQFPKRQQGVNNAIANVMQNEERAMDREGQALSPGMLASSRSASGKMALQNAADRPKQYSILNIANGVENHWERMYQLLQRQVGREEMILPIQGGDAVVLNQKEKEPILEKTYNGEPLMLDSQKSAKNPLGLVFREEEFTKGDLTVPMYAQADTRGMWPTGLRAKLQLASGMAEAGVLLSQKTVRELVLDERTKQRDDMNAAEEQGAQGEQQRLLEALQGAQAEAQRQSGILPKSAEGSQNPDLASATQTGTEQTRPGGGAGPREEQVGQERRSPGAETARQELEGR